MATVFFSSHQLEQVVLHCTRPGLINARVRRSIHRDTFFILAKHLVSLEQKQRKQTPSNRYDVRRDDIVRTSHPS
jgi:hypothetical protein